MKLISTKWISDQLPREGLPFEVPDADGVTLIELGLARRDELHVQAPRPAEATPAAEPTPASMETANASSSRGRGRGYRSRDLQSERSTS